MGGGAGQKVHTHPAEAGAGGWWEAPQQVERDRAMVGDDPPRASGASSQPGAKNVIIVFLDH